MSVVGMDPGGLDVMVAGVAQTPGTTPTSLLGSKYWQSYVFLN